MKVFITGGTGFVGGHLINKLLKQGHHVACYVREGSRIDRLDKKVLVTNKINMASNADIIYHLAGVLGKKGNPLIGLC